jgi:hypothetical protein
MIHNYLLEVLAKPVAVFLGEDTRVCEADTKLSSVVGSFKDGLIRNYISQIFQMK